MDNTLSQALHLVAGGDFLTAGGVTVIHQAADELERLRADKARLDWLESHQCNGTVSCGDVTVPGPGEKCWLLATSGSLRDAIDFWKEKNESE